MKKVNLLLISNMYPTESSPSYGIMVKNLEEGINEYSASLRVISKCVIKGRSVNWTAKIIKYVRFYCATIYKILSLKYDFIYVHYVNHSVIPLLIMSFGIRGKLILCPYGSDLFPENRFGIFLQRLSRIIINEAHLVVVPTEYFRNQFLKRFPKVSKERVVKAPFAGVDLRLFNIQSRKERQKGPLRLGFVHRIDFGKGWDVFLKTLAKMRDENISFEAYVIGNGAQIDDFHRLLRHLKLADKIHWRPLLPHKELVSYYKSFDVFVFPSRRFGESLGLVGIEAMACGVPVIGSDIGGITEYLKDEENGFVFSYQNDNGVYLSVKKFMALTNQEKINMSKKAEETSLLFNRERVIRILEDAIRKSRI